MSDDRKWHVAWARFDAFRNNIPPWLEEKVILEFNGIVKALQEASGEDLSEFMVPDSELKPKVTSFSFATRRRPGVTNYSDKRYCDDHYLRRQIDAIVFYFQNLQPPPDKPKVGF